MNELLIEDMAKAIYESIFVDEWRGGDGIEAELYRQAAHAAYAVVTHPLPTKDD